MATPHRRACRAAPSALWLAALSIVCATGCSQWLFSGVHRPDKSRPVMRLETRGGVEYAVGTPAGILCLGRTAQSGPCRIHHWLGPTPMVEDGTLARYAGVFHRADMDLRHQSAAWIERDLEPDEELVAMVYEGADVVELPLQRAREPGIAGDAVHWPGRDLPAGTGVFARADDRLLFVGMIAGRVETAGQRYLVHTGTTALREALLTDQPLREPRRVKHRPDDITVQR